MAEQESTSAPRAREPGPGAPAADRNRVPFQRLPPVPRSLVDRVLRRRPPAGAFVELNNLLASVRDLHDVNGGDVERICRAWGIDVPGAFGARCQQLYRDYLHWCLTDRRLSDEELDNLAHLALLLHLDRATAEAVYRATTRAVYLRSVEDVLADGEVSEAERQFLRRLGEDLRIPAGTADNMLDVRRRQMESRKRHRD